MAANGTTATDSLSRRMSHNLSPVIAACITISLLCNTGLFAWSLAQVNATAVVSASIPAGGALGPATMYELSFSQVFHDVLSNRVSLIGVLVVVFSGVWPFVKLASLLACWVLPSPPLCTEVRGRVLDAVHALGSSSLADVVVVQVSAVAFHLHLSLVQLPGLAVDLTSFVLPGPGVFGLLAGTMASVLITHLVRSVHRHDQDDCQGRRRVFPARDRAQLSAFAAWGPRQHIFVAVLPIVASLAMACAALLPVARVEVGGLTRPFLESNEAVRSLSCMKIGANLPQAAALSSRWERTAITVAYFAGYLAFPIASPVLAGTLWLLPLPVSLQAGLLHVAEIMGALSALDVLGVMLVVGLPNLEHLSQWMVHTRCAAVETAAKPLTGLLPHADEGCFTLRAELQLVSASVLLIVSVAGRALRQNALARCQDAICERRRRAWPVSEAALGGTWRPDNLMMA